MNGINEEMIDSIISKLQDMGNSSASNFRGVDNSFDALTQGVRGSEVLYILEPPFSTKFSIKEVIENYIDLLNSVKTSYVKQNNILQEQINHINSRL